MKDLKILLMHAFGRKHFHDYPDLKLGYIAAALEKTLGLKIENIKILCRDLSTMTEDKLKVYLAQNNFDVIGVKAFSGMFEDAENTLRIAKETLPDALRLVGGPHPSSVQHKIFEDIPHADFAFIGETEHVLPEFLKMYFTSQNKDYSTIDNLVWRSNSQVVVNKFTVAENFGDIAHPLWEILSPERTMVNPFNGVSKKSPIAPIMLSRGCNFHCSFCSTHMMNGAKVRYRPIKSVLDEMEYLINNYGIKEFHIVDTNSTSSIKLFEEFCEGIVERKFGIAWSCPHGIRTEHFDEDVALLMRKSGCYSVYVGVESGSPEILKRIRKGTNLKKLKEKVSILDRAGISVFGFFIIGFPGETRAQIQMTVDYALELAILGGSFAIFTPFPGTRIYDELCEAGKITEAVLQNRDTMNYSNTLSELSPGELQNIRKRMFAKLYLRPRTLFYYLRHLATLNILKFLVKSVLRQYFGFWR